VALCITEEMEGPETSDGKGKERKGKERKGKERKGKERKGKERKGNWVVVDCVCDDSSSSSSSFNFLRLCFAMPFGDGMAWRVLILNSVAISRSRSRSLADNLRQI
jgi:hypothetical protein